MVSPFALLPGQSGPLWSGAAHAFRARHQRFKLVVGDDQVQQVKTFASEMENMARKNPLGTIGATLLVGVVIGMMSRGRA